MAALTELTKHANMRGSSIYVQGEVVSLRQQISNFALVTLPDLRAQLRGAAATAADHRIKRQDSFQRCYLSKCLFVIGNLIVAFPVGESRLTPRRNDDQPSLVNEIHEEHVKRNMAMVAKAATEEVMVADHSASVGVVGLGEEVEVKEEEGEEEELHKRVEDFIARVKKQRKLEAKSFFDVDR